MGLGRRGGSRSGYGALGHLTLGGSTEGVQPSRRCRVPLAWKSCGWGRQHLFRGRGLAPQPSNLLREQLQLLAQSLSAIGFLRGHWFLARVGAVLLRRLGDRGRQCFLGARGIRAESLCTTDQEAEHVR